MEMFCFQLQNESPSPYEGVINKLTNARQHSNKSSTYSEYLFKFISPGNQEEIQDTFSECQYYSQQVAPGQQVEGLDRVLEVDGGSKVGAILHVEAIRTTWPVQPVDLLYDSSFAEPDVTLVDQLLGRQALAQPVEHWPEAQGHVEVCQLKGLGKPSSKVNSNYIRIIMR